MKSYIGFLLRKPGWCNFQAVL